MAEFKITDVSEHTSDWSNDYGEYRTYLVRLEGEGDEQVQINRKKMKGEFKVPKVDDVIKGTIEITPKGKKFKVDYSATGSSSNRQTSYKKDGPSEEYWASKDARISRQWAMGRGLELLIANRKDGEIVTVEQISKAADEFEKHLPEIKSG